MTAGRIAALTVGILIVAIILIVTLIIMWDSTNPDVAAIARWVVFGVPVVAFVFGVILLLNYGLTGEWLPS